MDRGDGASERAKMPHEPAGEAPGPDDEPPSIEPTVSLSRMLVLMVVAAGLVAAEAALLVERGTTWTVVTPLLALITAIPYLIIPRLAAHSAPPETLVGALLLFSVGIWADVSAPNTAQAWILVAIYLIAIEMAIFALGRLLRAHIHGRRQRAR